MEKMLRKYRYWKLVIYSLVSLLGWFIWWHYRCKLPVPFFIDRNWRSWKAPSSSGHRSSALLSASCACAPSTRASCWSTTRSATWASSGSPWSPASTRGPSASTWDWCWAAAARCRQGWKKPVFLVFFWFFWGVFSGFWFSFVFFLFFRVFLSFFVYIYIYIYLPRRESFYGFSVSRILLGASRL